MGNMIIIGPAYEVPGTRYEKNYMRTAVYFALGNIFNIWYLRRQKQYFSPVCQISFE